MRGPWHRLVPREYAHVAGAAPDLALGLAFLVAWVVPGALAPGMLAFLVLVMVLEFIIIHSSMFMGSLVLSRGSPGARAVAMLGLGAFYTLFVGGFSLAFRTLWPLVSFWGLTLNRLLGVLAGQAPEGEEKKFLIRAWLVSLLFYLGGAMVTVMLPVPRLGLDHAAMARQPIPGSGGWVDEPWRLCAFGFLYFVGVGLSGLAGHRWMRVQTSLEATGQVRARRRAVS